ncbi:MAG: hypothetical protein KME18_17510 [Phormidium tanganyikae FI6-MK23]|jgi:predicted RNase H-like HicB family nuclease|nr:hypothetical protein [Phormidium tanganyikae FI6-MK23]
MVKLTQSYPPTQLKVTLLVETLESGKFAASIFEFPGCRIEANTRESAIGQVQSAFLERLRHIEAIYPINTYSFVSPKVSVSL